MKVFLSDRESPVGKALAALAVSRGYALCGDGPEDADIAILCARRADPHDAGGRHIRPPD